MGLNDYFGTRRTNRPHETTNDGPGKARIKIDYYRQTYPPPENLAHIYGKLETLGQEVIYSSKYFNSNLMEFVGYDKNGKLIWTSGEGIIITNKISKQWITKTRINKIS